MREVEEQQKNCDGKQGQDRVQKDSADLLDPLLFGGSQLRVVGDAYFNKVAEVPPEVVGIQIPFSGIAFEGQVNYFLQLGRDCRIDFARRRGILPHTIKRLDALKWRLSGQHLVEHNSERVDVAASISAFSAQLFGRDKIGRAHV